MKVTKALLLLFFLFFLCTVKLQGQYVSYGNDPWGQRWQQIATPHFTLIYPKAIDSLAQRYAWLLDTAYAVGSKSIGHKPGRIPVLLHPDNVYANGVVVWAPRRMELYTTPPIQSYPQPWDRQLALHEFRHVAQTDKMNRGIMRGAYYLLGEQASALWLLPVPKWFMEGDAVATETALSSSGRGRMAEFNMRYRALLLAEVGWSYDKWVNGSYRHNVPSIYHFGYQNVAYARYRHGVNLWDKVLSESSRGYFRIPAFSNALRKHTGLTVRQLQKETFSYLTQQWKEEDKALSPDTTIRYITPYRNDYISYSAAEPLNDTTFVLLKKSMGKAPAMVMVTVNGNETHLLNHGNINDGVKLYNGKLYWTESVEDPRWEQRSYTNVKSYDPTGRKVEKHTHRSRYFAIAFNEDLTHYAASTVSREGVSSLCLLDAVTSREVRRYPVPMNSVINELEWIESDKLAVLLTNEKGIGIYSLNTDSGEWRILLGEQYVNLSGIRAYHTYLIFESGHSGINNIYALSFADSKVRKLTSVRFGAFDAVVRNGKLYFSDYQKNGLRFAEKPLNPQEWEEVDWGKPYRFGLAETLSAQEGFNIDTVAVSDGKLYQSRPYRKGLHLFRFHSWMPLYVELGSENNFDPDELIQSVKPGFMLLSQNSLSTAVTRLGYSYRNGYSAGHASFTYQGWYPVIDITADYGGGKQLLVNEGELREGSQNSYEIGTNLYIPLTFNGTRTVSGLIPQVSLKYGNDSYYVPSENSYQENFRLDLFLQHYTYSRSAVRDIYPRWGYRILLAHRSMPFDTENFGSIYGAKLTLYIPGLLANHGLKLSGTIQNQEVKRYYSSNIFSEPRGYSAFISKRMQFFSADYAFPVAYPDFNLGSLLYVKRFRLNLFADAGQNSFYTNNGPATSALFSYGADFIADYHIARKEFPFMTGIRLVKPRNSNPGIEVLFNVSF